MDDTIQLALETIKQQKQAIVFCASRASAEKTAEDIAKKISQAQVSNLLHAKETSGQCLNTLASPTKQCKRLAKTLEKEIAFHHSGLASKQKETIEGEFRKGNIKIICATPTLCLAKGTEVWHANGQTPVQKLKTSSRLFVLSQEKLISVKPKQVIKNHNSMNLIQITSVSGHSIKLTPNHKILVKRNSKRELILASECTKKDKVATIGKITVNNTKNPKLSDFIVDNVLPLSDRRLTKDDFYFIGSMLGDGYSGGEIHQGKIRYKGSPSFTSADEESLKEIERIYSSFHGFSKRKKRFGSVGIILTKEKWFREFLCRVGVDVGKEKFIHLALTLSSEEKLAALIQGLFDTDGYVQSGRSIGFSNISLKLIKGLQRSLLRFGIITRMRKRPGKKLNITGKTYHAKEQYEMLIAQNRSILLFHEFIGFRLKRKQLSLNTLVDKISTILYSECMHCNYKIFSDIFSGRTQQQREWGSKKRKIIALLGKSGELGSNQIVDLLGFTPRHKSGRRLNHHYELIAKRKRGLLSKTEWFWSLNKIGMWVYNNYVKKNNNISEFMKRDECPICEEPLHKELRKKWRDSDIEGDIFWDVLRSVEKVDIEEEVYDVVLPDKPQNDHLFVANGFIVHNSAGLSLPVFRVICKSLKRFSGRFGMNWIPTLEYLQMAGRAGRPEYESFGEAIAIAKNEGEKEEIYQRYVCGKPEEIYSKLNVEPVLRMYVLSLIASGVIKDTLQLKDFFSQTFWAHQFEDMYELELIIAKIIQKLQKWEFIFPNELTPSESTVTKKASSLFTSALDLSKSQKKSKAVNVAVFTKSIPLRATLLGRRVSELYLDPLTASELIERMQEAQTRMQNDSQKPGNTKLTPFSYLQAISNTIEMQPLLRIKSKEQEEYTNLLLEKYEQLLQEEPDVFSIEYPDFMNSIKTTYFFIQWINEVTEDHLLDSLGIRPGEIRVKLENANWLLYSCYEMAKVLGLKEQLSALQKLRTRIKYGVREELLVLMKFKGIGRQRARKLFSQGIKSVQQMRLATQGDLAQMVGPKLAASLKDQLGQKVEPIKQRKRKGQMSLTKYD